MKALFAALALFAGSFGVASAQTTAPGLTQCLVATASAVNCITGNGVIVMVENISQTAQTVTVTCTANGRVAKEIGALGVTQVISFSAGQYKGTPFTGNLVCTPSGAPIAASPGDGIAIWWSPP